MSSLESRMLLLCLNTPQRVTWKLLHEEDEIVVGAVVVELLGAVALVRAAKFVNIRTVKTVSRAGCQLRDCSPNFNNKNNMFSLIFLIVLVDYC